MRRSTRALTNANPHGNPKSLNFSHWHADGIHNKPVNQRRVAAGSAIIVATAFVVFQGLSMLTRSPPPTTLSKEWQAAQAKRHRERQMSPISQHKKGTAVTVYEPSIVEGQD